MSPYTLSRICITNIIKYLCTVFLKNRSLGLFLPGSGVDVYSCVDYQSLFTTRMVYLYVSMYAEHLNVTTMSLLTDATCYYPELSGAHNPQNLHELSILS